MRNVKTPTPKFSPGTLRRAGTPHTLRLQALMEQQQKVEIGQRIRDLREASPHTNRSIADAVDVSERAVTGWISGRGITWEHVEAVADLFRVDATWLWSGREKPTGSPLDHLSEQASESDLVEELHEIRDENAKLRDDLASLQVDVRLILSLLRPDESEPLLTGELGKGDG